MSVCISKHGEYGWHECSVDFICDYCGERDIDGMFAALNDALSKVARVEALHVVDDFGLCTECRQGFPCDTSEALTQEEQ